MQSLAIWFLQRQLWLVIIMDVTVVPGTMDMEMVIGVMAGAWAAADAKINGKNTGAAIVVAIVHLD